MIFTSKNRASISGMQRQATKAALASAIVLIVIGGVGCGGGAATHVQSSSQSAPQAATATNPSGSTPTFTILHNFTLVDGANPYGNLIQDASGNLYGVTQDGGAHFCGAVFKVDLTGMETVLHNFNCTEGNPSGGLVRDASGNLYGTTGNGGACGKGTVFKLEPTGQYTVLHSFSGFDLTTPDGNGPKANLVLDASGNLFGTTDSGGVQAFPCGALGCGTVFKLDLTTGRLTLLHSFSAAGNGAVPFGGLVGDSFGNLYGTTFAGGDPSCDPPFGCGTAFKLDPAGKLTILHAFTKSEIGDTELFTALVRDSSGNLYGTMDGCSQGRSTVCGLVFKLDPTGALTILHKFSPSEGWAPEAGVILDSLGNLYGTTSFGGACDDFCGSVFKLDPRGALTILHLFSGVAGGRSPRNLVRDASGNLFGTTFSGGQTGPPCSNAIGCGTVFKLTP